MSLPCIRSTGVSLLFASSLIVLAQQAPPTSRTENFRETFHGKELIDPYHWLEDSQALETRKWIDAQNIYAHALLDRQPLRSEISNRLTEMSRHDHIDSPLQRNGYYYFRKRGAEQELWSFYRRKGTVGHDELLLDPHLLNPNNTTSISEFDVSDDGELVAYGVRQGGQDETELRILDASTHRDLPDRLPKGLYSGFAFKKDRKAFYYTIRGRESYPRILYHVFGTDINKDVEIFGKGFAPDTWMFPIVSEDGRYLLVSVQRGWAQGDIYIQNLETETALQPLIKGLAGKFDPYFCGNSLFVQTDWKAPRGRILKIDLLDPAQDKWREVVPEARDAIDQFSVVGGSST